MLVRALLQTSLVLWLAQQTLQGGVKPQGVSWGKVLPARGVGLGVGVKPGVGALGALGSRYGSKAMKTGIGRYPGAQLGVGGYRSLGLGGRMKQGGYGAQGPYGANLGTGMPLGTGLTNGLGMGVGQAQKRAYGAGLGSLPGYGALPGNGHPGARPGARPWFPTGHRTEEQIPGVSAPELGGPELAGLGQAVPDPKREKSRAVAPFLFGKNDRTLGPEVPTGRGGGGGGGLGPAAAPELQAGGEAQSLGPSSLRPTIPLDKPIKNLGQPVSQGEENNEPVVLKRKSPPSRGAALAAGGVRQELPPGRDDTRRPSSITDYGSPFHQNQPTPNCDREISRHELLGSETQRGPGLVPRPPLGKDGRHVGPDRTNPLPLTHTQEVGGNVFSPPAGQGARNYLSAVAADRQGITELEPMTEVRGTGSHSPVEPQVPGRGRHGPVIPHASVVLPLVEGREAEGFTADSQDVKTLYHDAKEPKALGVPRQAGRNNQATRYIGGGGNYLGAGLGPGAYGAGLGQGAYLGGAAGKLGAAGALGQGGYPHGVAGKSPGYGDGAAGYLGATAGNGYGGDAGAKALSAGYGNGYGDGYGAGLGYPAELADGAENKAGKSQALTAGAYAGQVQGAYGALGAGLEPNGGKYGGGAAQGPYGTGPVIPAGLEGDGTYPYAPQQLGLGAEGAKTSNKYGYRAQLGGTQDALGEQNGKYGGVNGALGNGYKG